MKSLRSFGIEPYIPSCGRWEIATTQKLLHEDDAVFVVRESQKEQYEAKGFRVKSYPDEEINSLTKVRQKIIDDCPSDYCLQLDDDITEVHARTQEVRVQMENEDFWNELLRAFCIIDDLKIGVFTIGQEPSGDIRKYNRPFSFVGTGGTILGFNKPCLKARYDPNVGSKVDTDFILQELLYNRIVLVIHYFGVSHDVDILPGGQQFRKTSQEVYRSVEYLKAKWSDKIYDFNFDSNTSKIKVKRS